MDLALLNSYVRLLMDLERSLVNTAEGHNARIIHGVCSIEIEQLIQERLSAPFSVTVALIIVIQ